MNREDFMSHRVDHRIELFIGLSILAHLLFFAVLWLVLVLPSRDMPLNAATFELVGPPGPPAAGPITEAPPAPPAPTPEVAEPQPEPEPTPPEPSPIPIPKEPKKDEKKPPKEPVKEASKTPSRDTTSIASSTTAPPGATGTGAPSGAAGVAIVGGGGPPSIMGPWLARVKFLVQRQWRAPEGLEVDNRFPVIHFTVTRDGQPRDIALSVSSGSPTVDNLALRAIKSIDAFPPLPQAWPKDEVSLRYVLEYQP